MTIDNRALQLFYAKDEKTVASFYYAYGKLVFLIALDITKSRSEAEEVVQEAFLRILQKGEEQVTNPKLFLPFLCKVAKNIAIDKYRSSARYTGLDEEVESRDPAAESEILERLKDLLAEKEYKALILHLYADLPFKDIAPILEVTPSAARGYYHRALQKAKENLNKEDWL